MHDYPGACMGIFSKKCCVKEVHSINQTRLGLKLKNSTN